MTTVEPPDFVWSEPPTAPPERRQESATRHRVPGEPGLWVFVLGDMTMFAVFFTVFAWKAHADRALFAGAARQLHISIGATNTMVLLIGSYLVAAALHAGRSDRTGAQRRLLWGAMACAGVFATLKAVEWTAELSAGHTPASNAFFTFYYVLCGVHLLHVGLGTLLLAIWQRTESKGLLAECAATYWHMVDLLWIVIFTLLYVAVPV
jgi:nitric oxide reductase NorE protein